MAFIFGIIPASAAENWGCYDPKPGHPTANEISSFVETLRPIAIEIQSRYGIPRAGILSMAMQESGFGWTRTAISARNYFGWKYGRSARESGLTSWVLECQPPSDPGKEYAVFPTGADSLRFVASQLAQGLYRTATVAARSELLSNVPEKTRTKNWLKAIQIAGYNPNPNYPDDVMRTGSSGGAFENWSAVATSEDAATTAAPRSDSPLRKALSLLQQNDAGRYMIHGRVCTREKSAKWPGYESLPDGTLQVCQYTVTSCTGLPVKAKQTCETNRTIIQSKTASVVLLEPGLNRFAAWIASACTQAGGDIEKCLAAMYSDGNGQSNWQIPVAGIVFEAMDSTGWVEHGFAFRDGLTVQSDDACGWKNGAEAAPTQSQNEACTRPVATPLGVSNKARPMSTLLTELNSWKPDIAASVVPGHREGYPIKGEAAGAWARYVRDTLVKACSSDDNPLVTARAIMLRRAGKF
ncbi:glucosaminidase domain-containing protein [Mesorhizobium sp. LNJC384A00]|uniref:glucosaminidase domain-containing protein n=1 Tax=Mesorhizobium sp. LNJC384A00 TaxID=1287268 RepID=UPI0018DBC9C0|nr:glucosaminidase domain-containing protein [Mesorhizobium sp. LNJC384A00]